MSSIGAIKTAEGPAPESVIDYIEEMLDQLGMMAARSGHRHLATLIQMAALEAALAGRDGRR
jgi:hypothetical protein